MSNSDDVQTGEVERCTANIFENIKADFKRISDKRTHEGKGKIRKIIIILLSHPGFQAVLNYRICHWLVAKKGRFIRVVFQRFIHVIFQRMIEVLTGISICSDAQIGKGLLIVHFGGIVINSYSVIGEYCTISHCVTIGNKVPFGKAPVIGDNVYICVGAKILGDITIGDNCIIGANAVVLKSFPPDSVIAGIPAKVINSFDKDDHKEFNHKYRIQL